jgi:hypothetical protein
MSHDSGRKRVMKFWKDITWNDMIVESQYGINGLIKIGHI